MKIFKAHDGKIKENEILVYDVHMDETGEKFAWEYVGLKNTIKLSESKVFKSDEYFQIELYDGENDQIVTRWFKYEDNPHVEKTEV